MTAYPLTKKTHCKRCGSIGPFRRVQGRIGDPTILACRCGFTWPAWNLRRKPE